METTTTNPGRRIRVEFEDRRILKKSQRKEGLNRSWLLLKPSLRSISDVSSHISDAFHLRHSCPNGIILSMDGFVLPSFESASLLKDKDVIGVRRKGKLLSEIINADDGENLIEDGEILEKQALLTNVPLLANEEFEKESGGYQSESEPEDQEEEEKEGGYQSEPEREDQELEEEEGNESPDALYKKKISDRNAVSKKRKASKELGSSKKKKKKKKKNCHVDLQVSEDDLHIDQIASNEFHLGKGSDTKKKVAKKKDKHVKARVLDGVESIDDTCQPEPSLKRASPTQENDIRCDTLIQAATRAEKGPSRSARRKKAKREWLKEIRKAEKKEEELKQMQSPDVDVNKYSIEHQQQNQSCEADKRIVPDTDTVPIVIRPGHIRFEPLEEDANREAIKQHPVPSETFQWNGITNKKKGQKWGKEKNPSWTSGFKGSKKGCSDTMEVEVKPLNDPIDFDKLAPISGLPKEGDLLAYRLLELSSTWTPEFSSFRVGKTARFDPKSENILLTPLPEYPITLQKPDEEDTFTQPPDNSLYKEDGSLEVPFESLYDVRIVKYSNSNPATTSADCAHNFPMSNGATSSTPAPIGDNQQNCTPNLDNLENPFAEIIELVDAKKAELMRENGEIEDKSGNGAWSFRALRGSALGPALGVLRANNYI